jgi:nicotinamide riboside kinase
LQPNHSAVRLAMPLYKICLLGAESTGKSTLAEALSSALRARGYWAQATPEALRVFCERFGRLPLMSDEAIILKAQKCTELAIAALALKREADEAGPSVEPGEPHFLISDSSPLLTAFTSRWYFRDESLLQEGFDHQPSYLQCFLIEPSLAWEPDGIQRDGPGVRAKFHADLRDFLNLHHIAFEAIALKPDAVSKSSGQARAMADQLLAKAGLPQRR